ncbi:MAG: hypothetical protein ACTTIC_00775 [Helicobacteraceae bacterium]
MAAVFKSQNKAREQVCAWRVQVQQLANSGRACGQTAGEQVQRLANGQVLNERQAA